MNRKYKKISLKVYKEMGAKTEEKEKGKECPTNGFRRPLRRDYI